MSARDPGFWQDLSEVTRGRGQLRLILQPLLATIVGIRMGISDAKLGYAPFIKRVAFAGEARKVLVEQALRKVLVPFCVAIVIDGILQYLMHGYVRPFAALVMGALLIWIPFSLARSIANRVYTHQHPHSSHPAAA